MVLLINTSMLELTNYETNESVSIKISDIDAYRGNTGYTSIYMKDDSCIRVKEDFDVVDELFEKEELNILKTI